MYTFKDILPSSLVLSDLLSAVEPCHCGVHVVHREHIGLAVAQLGRSRQGPPGVSGPARLLLSALHLIPVDADKELVLPDVPHAPALVWLRVHAAHDHTG